MQTRTHFGSQRRILNFTEADCLSAKGKRPAAHGQGLPEYALILALVAVVVVGIMALLGAGVKQAFCKPLIGLNPEYAIECLAEPMQVASAEDASHPISALAAYSNSRGDLVVAAKLPSGVTGTLTVAGYGTMTYVESKDVYVLVIHTDSPPPTVTVNSADGGTITVDVRTL